MKKFIYIFLLLFINYTQSQEVITHELFSPESKELSDLQFLNSELEGKPLVMLGEMTHMYGNIFEMKARVIEYLHSKLGYTTIAMESSMYDLWLMNSRHAQFNPVAFNEAVFGVWSDTSEFQRLVQYIEENDLKVIGFDSQIIHNTPDFIDDFFRFCSEKNISIKLDEDDFGLVMEEVLDDYLFEEEDITFRDFEKELNRIIRKMEKLESTETNFYWLQFTKSLLASSKDAFFNKEEILTSDLVNQHHNFRDEQMADNLLSYIARNQEDKIIVWADNVHIINDIGSYQQPVIKDFVGMGSHIKKALGEEVYSLATFHANDSLFDGREWHSTPVKKASFEDKLVSLNKPYLFISSNQHAMKKLQESRLLSFIDYYEGRLDQLHDGYIFLKNATYPRIEKDGSKILEKRTIASEKSPLEVNSEIGKNEFFKSRVIDATTKQPVPYANIILKEKEIYRISDTDGNFELSMTGTISPEAVVDVSSMGYETQSIHLGEWKEVIHLAPKSEQLDEVILTGYNITPKKVLKRAIKAINNNHPTTPFNYTRYGHYVLNSTDKTLQDLEVITIDYNEGYRQHKPRNQKVLQVKWNKSLNDKNFIYSTGISGFREDAIQYAPVLHKRKFKKFDLEFLSSLNAEKERLYVIKFSGKRDRFGYTNRWYPSSYSGEIYISKADFAIIKVIQNWETTVPEEKMEKYEYWLGKFKNSLRLKEELVSIYEQQEDQKYYATQYFRRTYKERTSMEGDFVNSVFEGISKLYGFEQQNIEPLFWENRMKDAALNRVEYDVEFWENYEKEQLK